MEDLERAAREVRERCVCIALRQAARAVTQHYEQANSGAGTRATQFSLLVALAQAPFVPLSRLAEALVMDRSTLTRNLAPLVREGLVEARPGADKRVRAFGLTARGKKAFERSLPGWKKAQAHMLRALAPKDVEELRRILGAAVSAAQHA